VPGVTVNRYCASGLETIAMAAAKIHSGIADCIIAGGVACMSPIPFGGWRIVPNAQVAKVPPSWYWGMGLTAEAVARDYNVARADQDEFGFTSHNRAAEAIATGRFKNQIVPIEIEHVSLDENGKRQVTKKVFDTDEGPRANSSLESMAKLRPVFDAKGTVTAGNASQTSDGAAFVMLVSEAKLKELRVEPLAQLKSYATVGVEPRIMGIGPVGAIPKAIQQAGLSLNDINLFELNEAFASQSLPVVRELGLDRDLVNVNGGAIALGHPLGCTGAKLSVQLFDELKQRKQKHGVVTMCVGSGQGAAGVYEIF
jgi:acetyl-CoA acyltransferase